MNITEIFKIRPGNTFQIADTVFVKICHTNGDIVAITKDVLFKSRFGDNNNLKESEIIKRLTSEFLPKIAEAVGEYNLREFETDLTTLDGLRNYGVMRSKISLPTLDFYRKYVGVFDEHKISDYYWLSTPESSQPHGGTDWVLCVAPNGDVDYNRCGLNVGVRPVLHFASSTLVSCED